MQAILKSDSGEIEQAEQTLEASWKLNESLHNRPEEISFLLSMVVIRLQAGVLRQIGPLHEIWQARMSRPDLIKQYLYAQQTEGWALLQKAKKGDLFNGAGSDQGPCSKYVSTLHARLSLAKLSERKALATQELAAQSPCTPRRELSYSEIKAFFPGDSDAQIGYVDPEDGWNKTARTLLEMELTAEVLMIHTIELKESREFPSSVCPGESWTYRTGNGKGTLSFSKEIDWAALAPPDYPSSGQQPQNVPLIHMDDLQ